MSLRLTPEQQRLVDLQVHIVAVASELVQAAQHVTSTVTAWVPRDRELERMAQAVQLEHDRLQFAVSLYLAEKRKARQEATQSRRGVLVDTWAQP